MVIRKSVSLFAAECPGGAYFWLAEHPGEIELRPPLYEPIASVGIRDHELSAALRALTAWHLGVAEDGLFQGVIAAAATGEDIATGPLNGKWPSADRATFTEPTWTTVGEVMYCFPRTKTDLYELFVAIPSCVAYPDHGRARPLVWRGDDDWDMAVIGTPPLIMDLVSKVACTLGVPLLPGNSESWMRDMILDVSLQEGDDAPRHVVYRRPTGEIVFQSRGPLAAS